MAFEVNTITVQGAVGIASATAGNKLIIDGCDATTDILTKAQAVAISSRPATPASTTTSVALAGSTENHVYSYASFIQGETGQPGGDVHSFYLYGHVENAPANVFVIAIASSSEPVHLPESGDVTNRTEVQFELTFSATDEVVTVAGTSMYATRGELLLLKDRTVTTHAEGQSTTGEDQTIYGNKTFANAIKMAELSGISTDPIALSSNIYPTTTNIGIGYPNYFASVSTKRVTFGVDTDTLNNAYCSGDASSTIASAGVYSSSGGFAGSSARVFSRDLGSDVLEQRAILEVKNRSSQTVGSFTVGRNETGSGTVYIEGEIGTGKFNFDGTAFTITNADLTVTGTGYGKVYANSVIATDVQATGISVGASGVLTNKLSSLDGTTNIILSSAIEPNTAYIDIGTNSKPFRDIVANAIHANKLHGLIDSPTSPSNVPVGSIFFAQLTYDSSTLGNTHTVNIGDEIRTSSTDLTKPIHIYAARFEYNGPASSDTCTFGKDTTQELDDGIYQALSGGYCASDGRVIYVLVIKVGTVS